MVNAFHLVLLPITVTHQIIDVMIASQIVQLVQVLYLLTALLANLPIIYGPLIILALWIVQRMQVISLTLKMENAQLVKQIAFLVELQMIVLLVIIQRFQTLQQIYVKHLVKMDIILMIKIFVRNVIILVILVMV